MSNAEYVKATIVNVRKLWEVADSIAGDVMEGRKSRKLAEHEICFLAMTSWKPVVMQMFTWLDPTDDELEEGALLALEACME